MWIEMPTWHEGLALLGTMAALFSITLLRSAQNKNVAGGHKRLAFIFGTGMSACELLVMGLVASTQNPMLMMLGAIGSGIGWVAGMVLHDRIMRKKMAEAKAEKKSRRAKRIQTAAHAEIIRVLEEHNLI